MLEDVTVEYKIKTKTWKRDKPQIEFWSSNSNIKISNCVWFVLREEALSKSEQVYKLVGFGTVS